MLEQRRADEVVVECRNGLTGIHKPEAEEGCAVPWLETDGLADVMLRRKGCQRPGCENWLSSQHTGM